MLGISLEIIKGMLLLTVLSQLRLNVDDSSWFVHAKEICFFLILMWVVLSDIFSLHYLWDVPIISSNLIVMFLRYVFFQKSLFQQGSVLKEKMIPKHS